MKLIFLYAIFFLSCRCQDKVGSECQQCEQEFIQNCNICENNNNVFRPSEQVKSNIFNLLTIEELNDVANYVIEELDLATTQFDENGRLQFPPPSPEEDQLLEIDVFPVNKKQAIEYLDFDGVRPQKYARVTVSRGSINPPDVVEYKVGPLPVDNDTELLQIVEDGAIPWRKHPFFLNQVIYAQDILLQTSYYLRDIFKYQTGGFCTPYFPQIIEQDVEFGEDCGFVDRFNQLEYPAISEQNRRVGRIFYHFQPDMERVGDAYNLFPVPITFSLDTTHPDPKTWFVFDFVYCHQGPFDTKEELLEKFNSGELHRCEAATEWGTLRTDEDSGDELDNETSTDSDEVYDFRWADIFEDSIYSLYGQDPPDGQLQPRTFMPQGPRFQILGNDDPTGRRLKWLNWEAHFLVNNRAGITFFDITFKGERIIYELSLQEQFVTYAGFGGMGQLQYFDSYFGLGTSTTPLQRGVDCPEHAVFLSSVKSGQFSTGFIATDDICIFEQDLQTPLWRHYVPSAGRVFGNRDSQLIVRVILTLENYDYAYSIAFRRDGSVHVKVEMNGYCSSSFFDPQGKTWRDGGMGTRIHKFPFANLHDHLAAWKVDIDVKGSSNSFLRYKEKSAVYEDAVDEFINFLSTSPEKAYQAYKKGAFDDIASPTAECDDELEEHVQNSKNSPAWFENQETKYMQMKIEEQELGIKLSYEVPSIFQFINKHEVNKWGNPKGYGIMLGATTGQVLSEGHPFLQAAAWTKYHLAVTKRKEDEQSIMAAKYDWYLPQTPVVSLNDYINGESIRDEDLVAWVNVGVQHLPHSEDVPLISAINTGFQIMPRNYFEYMQGINGFQDTSFKLGCIPDIGISQPQFETVEQ
eukprot:TRINITY_DN1195_c0_g1_i3.p1 TRINITY_DN1195_c0_g1~~TRINITY_DN1195_c0_g1_i3.p1  ORF type:complete len:860 (+),score=136.35 TRINITY_DN1195_c0_g1_i3:914-3493(+)